MAEIADPVHLEYLFDVRLAALLRQGPGQETESPGRLLRAAQQAAAAAVVPVSAPSALRRTLAKLERRLYEAGAWDPGEPIWWSPLPAPTALEELWESLGPDDGPLHLPSGDDLAAAFAETDSAPRWLSLPTLLAPSLTRAVWRELEIAHGAGRLDLERAGVGAAGERSVRRSDWVSYVSGLEDDLLAAAPSLAVFVQWGLRYFARVLKAGGRHVYPPRKAMLARYPAPSAGYAPHLDNPGGAHENGRALTLVIYLNARGEECSGGEIALWGRHDSTEDPPVKIHAPTSGSAACFDSRAIAHQVRPLREGPARWALTFWFNDAPQHPEPHLPRPRLDVTDVLLPIAAPPLAAGTVAFHELNDEQPTGEIVIRSARAPEPRAGIVCTVYREDRRLDAWCEHHLSIGAAHLVLVFDHLEEPQEARCAERLRGRFSADRLTIWPGTAAAGRWSSIGDERLAELPRYAELGAASYAIASRQALNASVALDAARTDELGGAPLDWLLHLDADELFHLEGSGRGGASLGEHFAAATGAGLERLRYVNHEILLTDDDGGPRRFKVNPRLAAARLGPGGWAALVEHLGMGQTDRRPYFNGYLNGKSAVRVEAGSAAAGVHGWFLADSKEGRTTRFLAGPSVLHLHFSTPESFRRKYLAIAASPVPPELDLFQLSPPEEATVGLIRRLEQEGAGEAEIHRRLDELHEAMTMFAEGDVELLDAAGLVIQPPELFNLSRF